MKIDLKKQPKSLLLKNGTIVDPNSKKLFSGHVWIKNGKIEALDQSDFPRDIPTIDCSGKVITHGFCDLHAHFREPGREDKETLETGSNAALAGGFTRVCVMPNTDPPLDTPESIRFIIEKSEKLPIYIHPIGAITKHQGGKEITEMGGMVEAGAVAFSDDGLPVTDGQVFRLACEYAKMFGVPVINHAEDPCIRKNGVMHEGAVSAEIGLTGNPDVAESSMVNRDLELSVLTGTHLHVPHVSAEMSVKHLRKTLEFSKSISSEVTPHHLYFNHESLHSFDTSYKVAPPIRTEKDRLALISAVKEGIITCIATDHAPHTVEEKEADFNEAPFGMIGLESCFGAVNKVLRNELDIMEIICLLTVNPRKVMGFEIDLFKIGTPAELTILDIEKEWIFSLEDIHSKSRNTPFIDETIFGKVVGCFSKGNYFIS
ncbi:MAG: dihydroorotase [Candidatus Marinimicrobia bacterium]|jgi:dihydroorotase|nr:dihydroorotase [Candidatus Neomarinimicrobiota bacterium]